MRLADSLQAPADGEDSLQLLHFMVDIVNRTDSYTAGHQTRVADIAVVLARLTDQLPSEVDVIKRSAQLHDIGKIGIPEKILRKQTPLTKEERHLIDLHPIFGASMLSRITDAAPLIPGVLHHHEHWDGNGYPARLSMTDIPLAARIIGVSDAYDAMTSYRTYAPSMTAEEALEELRRCSGTQFEPRLVDAMHEAYAYGLIERRKSVVLPNSYGGVLS